MLLFRLLEEHGVPVSSADHVLDNVFFFFFFKVSYSSLSRGVALVWLAAFGGGSFFMSGQMLFFTRQMLMVSPPIY